MRLLVREPWFLLFTVFITLFLSNLVGYRLALASRINEDAHHHEHITGLREGLFVFLGLSLGFTMAMVLPRFDQRTDLVTKEADAIRATWLRAKTLPEPQRGKSLQLLREYVVLRRDFGGETLGNQSSLDRTTGQTKALQGQLWQQIVDLARVRPDSVTVAYEEALNDLIELSEKRLAAFESRIPTAVWVIILLVAAFQSFVSGYSLRRKLWLSLVVAPAVVAVVIMLIANLDDPHSGLMRIDQSSMDRVANDICQPLAD
jgi:Protein of unknown function (DUF4239)